MQIKELKHAILTKNNNDLIKFINKKFIYGSNIESNITKLKVLDRDVVEVGIARMKKIEVASTVINTVHIIATLLITIGALLAEYIINVNIIDDLPVGLLYLVFLFAIISIIINNSFSRKSSAIYFKSILEYIRGKSCK